MKNRCLNPNNPFYKNYGKRNIKICEEWLEFKNFMNWALNNGYNDSLTLDRIDVNKGYNAKNCRFVDMKTQQNNRSNNHYIEYNGERLTMKQWSDKLNIPYDTLECRINKLKWNIDEALGFKKRPKNNKRNARCKKIYCVQNGVIYDSLARASKELNIPVKYISKVLTGKQKQTKGYVFKYI